MKQRKHFAKRLPGLLAVGLGIALLGCESTFDGVKLAEDGSFPDGLGAGGVPLTLNKAEYSLSRKGSASGEPVYTINVAYVPDEKQRYTLRVDPSIFADTTFSADIGSGGVLTSTTGKRTDRVTPAIKAVGSFVGNVIGILATGVLDKATRRSYVTALIDDQGKICESTGDSLKKRILSFDDDDAFDAQFHYLSKLEKICLQAVKQSAEQNRNKIDQGKLERWGEARKDFLTATVPSSVEDKALLDRFDRAVLEGDTDVIERIEEGLCEAQGGTLARDDANGMKCNVGPDPKPNDTKLREALALPPADPSSENRLASEDKLASWGDLLSFARAAATDTRDGKVVDVLKAVIEMTIPTWRARHVGYLEREIECREFERLVVYDPSKGDLSTRCPRTQDTKPIEALQKELAQTIGASIEYARIGVLKAYLAELPTNPSEAGNVTAFEEYERAQNELDALTKAFQSARSRVIEGGKPTEAPKPKVKPFEDRKIVVKPGKFVDEANKNWKTFITQNPESPEFVIVLRRAP